MRGDRPGSPTIGAGSGLVMRNIGASVPEHADLTIAQVRENALRLAGAGTTEYAQADGISALTVASALVLGLAARDRTGISQGMRTTMLTSTAHALADDMVEHDGRAETAEPDIDLFGYGARYRLYQAADGWIYLAAPAEREWEALASALAGDADLAGDARFADEASRRAHDGDLAQVLAAVFAARSAQHWEDYLLGRDVGCVVAPRSPRRPSCRARSSQARRTCSCRSSTPRSASTFGSSHTSNCPAARPWPSPACWPDSTPVTSWRSWAMTRRRLPA